MTHPIQVSNWLLITASYHIIVTIIFFVHAVLWLVSYIVKPLSDHCEHRFIIFCHIIYTITIGETWLCTLTYNLQFVTHAIPSRITGGVISSGEPSSNVATQTISVPLYNGPATIVSVCTRNWLSSRSVPGVIPEGKFLPLISSPSMLHLM